MSELSNERRRFQRIAFDAITQLSQGERHWSMQLHDLSLKGLLLECPTDWDADPEQPLLARIELDPATTVTMQVLLTHRQGQQLGFVCQSIDLESISHLRRLVELNLGDQTLLERDLAALGQA
jgi:hypothetical protein